MCEVPPSSTLQGVLASLMFLLYPKNLILVPDGWSSPIPWSFSKLAQVNSIMLQILEVYQHISVRTNDLINCIFML